MGVPSSFETSLDEPVTVLGSTVVGRVSWLARELRRAGVPISMGQVLDAVQAVAVIDLADRVQVRAALSSTLVKRSAHESIFDRAFRATFSPPPPASPPGDRLVTNDRELGDALVEALLRGDPTELAALAGLAVGHFGGIDSERLSGERYHVRRTLQRVDLTRLLGRAVRMAEAVGDDLDVDALRARVAALEDMVVAETRRRLDPMTDGPEDGLVDPTEDLDFVEATPADVARLRAAVEPLARKLAARLSRQRQHRSSPRVDMRRTMRRSLASGGVPLDVMCARKRPLRPELVVLADISGSVAEFARFFLLLLHALHSELPKVRSFCFVDGVDEVSHLLATLPDRLEIRHLLATTNVVGDSGHSDYGRVFKRFSDGFGGAIGPRTTVLVAGDARSNGRDPGADALHAIRRRVRRLYWLNPEPRSLWETRDSTMAAYAASCDAIVEVRNIRQMSDFVLGLV